MRWLPAALLLAYPLLVYAGLARLDARLIWILLGALALVRLFLARERLARLRGGLTLPLALLGAGLLAVGVFSNDARTLVGLVGTELWVLERPRAPARRR